MEQLLSGGIAAVTAIAATLTTYYLTIRKDEWRRKAEEKRSVQLAYLNPLRRAVVEKYFRLKEIADRVDKQAKCSELLYIDDPKSVRAQPTEFNDLGAYLISPCYLAACFFASAGRIRRELLFLRLDGAGNTELLSRFASC